MTRGSLHAGLAAEHPRGTPLAHDALPARPIALGYRVVPDVARLPGRRSNAGSANIAAPACRGTATMAPAADAQKRRAALDCALDVAGWREIETRGTGTDE
jgi:hypothetical protein